MLAAHTLIHTHSPVGGSNASNVHLPVTKMVHRMLGVIVFPVLHTVYITYTTRTIYFIITLMIAIIFFHHFLLLLFLGTVSSLTQN